jgi:hypothetical protein
MRDITMTDVIDAISSSGDYQWPSLKIALSFLKKKGVYLNAAQEYYISNVIDGTIRDLKKEGWEPKERYDSTL